MRSRRELLEYLKKIDELSETVFIIWSKFWRECKRIGEDYNFLRELTNSESFRELFREFSKESGERRKGSKLVKVFQRLEKIRRISGKDCRIKIC